MTPPSANAPTILAILSGKGGVGKTMLAAATAYELSRVQPTLILDLDFFNRGLSGLLLNNRLGDEVSPPLFFVDDSAAPWTVSKVTTNIYTVSFPDIPDAISSRLSSISVNSLATQLHDWILEITRATGCRAVVLGPVDVLTQERVQGFPCEDLSES